MIVAIAAYYIIINLITFVLYGVDKHKARKGKWRISERVLLVFAIIGGALGAILGMKIFHHKTSKLKFKVVTIVFFIVHLMIVGFFAFTTLQIVTYGHKYEGEEADVAIVLGAATTGREVKDVFKERINEAIRLYEEGKCEKIILTGGIPKGSDVADSVLAKDYAVESGVPKEDILVETRSKNTEENIMQAKILMDKNGYTTALIVSDPLHMRRAVTIAKDLGIAEVYSAPTRTSTYKSFSKKFQFLDREEIYYVGHLILQLFGGY